MQKKIFYYDRVNHEVFMAMMGARADVHVDRLGADSSAATAAAVLGAAHAYQIGSARDELPAAFHARDALFARAPKLLIVSTHGAGYDTVDLEACTRAGVLAMNQAGGNAEAVAEHALGMMLCLGKRIGETDRVMRRAAGIRRNEYIGRDALGRTLGIVGLGHIGGRLAELCRGLLRMRVLACDPFLSDAQVAAKGAEKVSLDALLAEADYVSIHCPLNDSSAGMIGAAEYARMKPGAIFITTARGGIHDEAALADALRSGHLAGAGLDVWQTEPPAPDHPLLAFDNVLVSPHTAGVTHEAREHITRIAAEQLLGALEGLRPPRLLNPEAWPLFARRYEATFGRPPARYRDTGEDMRTR